VLTSDARIKYLQLNHGLAEVRRRLRQTVFRHHASSDPASLAQWRRGTAIVVQDRLQYLVEQGKLGRLQRFLTPSEETLIVPLHTVAAVNAARISPGSHAAPWREGRVGPGPTDYGSEPAPVTGMAEAAVAYWFKTMRRAARSQRLCRELGLEPNVLHHLIDELQIGALRCRLPAEITTAFLQLSSSSTVKAGSSSIPAVSRVSLERDCVRMAALACRLIAAYLEVLGSISSRGRNTSHRSPRSPNQELEVAEAASPSYVSHTVRPWGGARRSVKPVQAQWEVSFVTLVEDNITSSHLSAGRGDKDRELGELIQLFAPG
jgi:hypothetical protein